MNENQIEQLTQEAANRARELDDNSALSLVGAIVGDFYVKDRIKPGKRWRYVTRNTRTGQDTFLRGYELVRLAREAEVNDLPIVMPTVPWRTEK